MNNEKVILAGFGTLLLQESLGDTVGKDGSKTKKFTPIIIKNYQRLFNLLPDHYKAVNHLRQDETEIGAANIQPLEGACFNALCFETTAEELENLDKRERYYTRILVPYFDFETGAAMGHCHIYQSPLDARWLRGNIKELLPLWRDIVYARVGAYRVSEAFGKMYDATTYLADGQTLMIDYYKDYLKELEDLNAVRKTTNNG